MVLLGSVNHLSELSRLQFVVLGSLVVIKDQLCVASHSALVANELFVLCMDLFDVLLHRGGEVGAEEAVRAAQKIRIPIWFINNTLRGSHDRGHGNLG